jgi:hypothetical protein
MMGADAEQVDLQLRTAAAEQLFSVLGELKGGAMKFGQALSMFEAFLPEEIAAPYRQHLAKLQDAAPPLPSSRVQAVLRNELGPRWRDRFESIDLRPAAAASIGQVHRGVLVGGRPVAIKVQYPGADQALRSDLRQIGRMSKVISPLAGGMDVQPLVDATRPVARKLQPFAKRLRGFGIDGRGKRHARSPNTARNRRCRAKLAMRHEFSMLRLAAPYRVSGQKQNTRPVSRTGHGIGMAERRHFAGMVSVAPGTRR